MLASVPEEENEYRKEIKKEASDNQLDFFSPEFAQVRFRF